MSARTTEKLTYMANQIARNLAHDPAPAAAVAEHIAAFWTPGMIDSLLADHEIMSVLDPVAAEAMARVKASRANHAG